MKPRLVTRLFCAVVLVAALALSTFAFARPGGGHRFGDSSSTPSSYSSTPSSPASDYSYDSGGSGGDVFVEHPAALVLLIVLSLALSLWNRRNAAKSGWATARSNDFGESSEAPVDREATAIQERERAAQRAAKKRAKVYQQLARLREDDPHFSLVLFEDFLYALYARYQEARAGSARRSMRAYLTPRTKKTLKNTDLSAVRDIVIGSMTLTRTQRGRRDGEDWLRVTARFEANVTEEHGNRAAERYFLVDTWKLTRKCSATSRPPDRLKVVECPCCGGSIAKLQRNNVCRYCDATLTPGHFDWAVEEIDSQRSLQSPATVSEVHLPEIGTDMPTVIAAGMWDRYGELTDADPSFSWTGIEQRIGKIFKAFHEGWVLRDLSCARPFLSDQLFQMQQYWTESYRAAGLANKTDRARITDTQIAEVRTDLHYDAITVRVYATGLDYTVDEDGVLVSGSKSVEREYSEYWTLIRANGTKTRDDAASGCPSCGAPLDINMAGNCNHCDARVTSGQFDWVLSRIEQDESYV